jgi:membrane fusion protein (multidrug efflux system)
MKKRYIFFMAPVAMLAWASCKQAAPQNTAPPVTPVAVAEAKVATAVYYDQYQGNAVALNNVELRAQVAGYITGIFFKEGSVVTKGTQLYEIDRRKYQAAYAQAQANVLSANANLVKAQKDVDRYTYLLKQDAVARQTYDQAVAALETNRSQVAVAKAQVLSAQTDLSYSIIRAPFTGRIGISQVKLGAEVTPATTLLNTISSENPIGVDIQVDQNDINRFYNYQRHTTDSTFKLQLPDGTTYPKPGHIIAIDRGVNNQTGAIKVRIGFDNGNDVLKDGMSVVLKVLNDQSGQRLQIPFKAVSEQMGEYFVFVAQDTIAKQHKVTIGPRIGTDVVIMSGIEQGDKVITDGFQRLRDGGKITLGLPPQPGATGQQGGPSTHASGQPQVPPRQQNPNTK